MNTLPISREILKGILLGSMDVLTLTPINTSRRSDGCHTHTRASDVASEPQTAEAAARQP
jgi:hypothetical protein